MMTIINETAALELAANAGGRVTGLVAVHNGVVHADDAHFTAAVRILFPEAVGVRTRNPRIIETAQIVGDVGGVHNAEEWRFDHHQGAGARWDSGVPYAAFGLFWEAFGEEVCGRVAPGCNRVAVAAQIEEELVLPIDAADNAHGERHPGSVSAVISSFNPVWDEAADFDGAFARAVEMAGTILRQAILGAAATFRARAEVLEALCLQAPVADPEILLLERFLPWQDHLLGQPQADHVLYVVFPSEDGQYRVQAVPDAPDSFGMRRPLPLAWKGLRGAELAAAVRGSGGAIGDDEAVFCHGGLFIAGATTLEGAMQMARAALPS